MSNRIPSHTLRLSGLSYGGHVPDEDRINSNKKSEYVPVVESKPARAVITDSKTDRRRERVVLDPDDGPER